VSFSQYAALVAGGLVLFATSAYAGPTYTFTTSEGSQPSNVGTIILTQINSMTVDVLVDLIDTTVPNPQYGFVNTGGPHTPFTFTIAGSETGISATFIQPAGGSFCPGGATCPPTSFELLSLSTSPNESNTPFGTFGIAIDSTAQNGSGGAYFGDLEFTLTRPTGLSTDDFITNSAISPGDNAYFAADLTNGLGGTTGAQAWIARSNCTTTNCGRDVDPVPEPGTLAMLGTMLIGLGGINVMRRRREHDL
jgi:hypothetical protein